jgi:hypothetical protein
MKSYVHYALLILLTVPLIARSDGFQMFADLSQIKNTVVVEAGTAELVEVRTGAYSRKELAKVGDYCFDTLGSFSGWSFGKRAALVLMDQKKNLRLALFKNGVGAVEVSTLSVTQVPCP